MPDKHEPHWIPKYPSGQMICQECGANHYSVEDAINHHERRTS